MKKLLAVLLVIAVLFTLSAFIFIPSQLTISETSVIKASQFAVFRYLGDETKWKDWWPKTSDSSQLANNNSAEINGFKYELSKKLYNAIEINTKDGNYKFGGRIIMLPLNPDSLVMRWESHLSAGNNPVTRVLQYRRAVTIKKNMAVILASLKAFNENTLEVYNFNIRRTTLTDTFLVASKITTVDSPSYTAIYNMIHELKQYISSQNAKETNFPIMNITQENNKYVTMVAIATNKQLTGTKNISLKQFIIYKNKVIATEVKGGPATIQKAYNAIHTYLNDYNLITPVIPFEYLITDRLKETDTSKWVTKIYFPVA